MPIFFRLVGMDRISIGLPLYVVFAEGDCVQLQGADSLCRSQAHAFDHPRLVQL